jgi:hypothetical protein
MHKLGGHNKMVSDQKPKRVSYLSRINRLERDLANTKKEIRAIKDFLNVKNNSISELTEWLGQDVFIVSNSGRHHEGTLKWVGKYSIGYSRYGTESVTILQKGCIESISLSKREGK